ncbi:HNH endonuclease family protein [Sporosarcina sp. FA9]|uniref:HNH endonuclease family protein n=1 Tax=Sporosarcina sp. FA9 TaxID=3413030 RepID=UPI003F65B267
MEIDAAMDYFKRICLEDIENVLEISKWLYDVTHQLKLIEQNVKKKAVNKVKQARFLQVAIKLSGHITIEEEKELLELWEKTTFRVFGLYRKDSRHLVGEYVRLGHFIMGYYEDSIKYVNVRFVKTKEKLIEIALQHSWKDIGRILKEEKSYGIWNQELRYFLYQYEKELSKTDNYYFSERNWDVIWSKNIENTIEHIYPQQDSDEWKGKVLRNKDHYRHVIGNLILLPTKLNSKASNFCFKTKLDIYNSSDINAAKEIGHKYSDWNYNSINDRTESLIIFAQTYWGIEGK